MFIKLASFAAAVVVLASIAPPAHAGESANGVRINGTFINGANFNGLRTNGTFINSRNMQGTATGATGFAIDGIDLPRDAR